MVVNRFLCILAEYWSHDSDRRRGWTEQRGLFCPIVKNRAIFDLFDALHAILFRE